MKSQYPQCGFDTIGNATIIAYDKAPILVTDPWISDSAYFGSWGHAHTIPEEQRKLIAACEYVWFSHGHPDHLNSESLPQFHGKKILLPDHVGGRIKTELQAQGYDVRVLKNKEWVSLSPRVRILCLSDYNQDGILLIDINGRLLVNLNDAGNRGWENFLKKTIANYPISFLLALSGYGDADMINFFDEEGKRILPLAAKRFSVGAAVSEKVEGFGCKYFIPSSSMHRYQRSDSAWVNEFGTRLEDYSLGYESKSSKLLPAYLRYDCESDQYYGLAPASQAHQIRPPEDFGDNWSDLMSAEDFKKAENYFQSIEHLHGFLDFINLRVGGKDNIISLSKQNFSRGITFETPLGSLKTALEYEIFDDLLIGNFMKTRLQGKWPKSGLYPDFSPYVAKYADNGRAKSNEEVANYLAVYRKREPIQYLRHIVEQKSKDIFRSYIPAESAAFQKAKRVYWGLKKHF